MTPSNLRGPMTTKLTLEEWATWIRLNWLMADCPFQPELKLDESGVGLDDESMAEQLRVPLDVWVNTKAKLLALHKIILHPRNVIKIRGWKTLKSQAKYVYDYWNIPWRIRHDKELYRTYIKIYAAIKKLDLSGVQLMASSLALNCIDRYKEGADWMDFRRVIMLYRSNRNKFSFRSIATLFGKGYFWKLCNWSEPYHGKADIGAASARSQESRIEYHRQLRELMKKMGWENYKYVNWKVIRTEADFIGEMDWYLKHGRLTKVYIVRR